MATLQTFFAPALALAAFLVSVPLALGFLGRVHPAFDSFAHFRLHLAGLLLVTAVLLLATRFRLEGILALVLACGAVATTLMASRGLADAGAPLASPAYRLMHLNLRFNNSTPDRVIALIERLKPDVITLNEVSDTWQTHLAALTETYPHTRFCLSPMYIGGVAILSRRPMVGGSCGLQGRIGIQPVDFDGRTVEIVAIHLDWPWPHRQFQIIETMRDRLGGLSGTALLAGDFNAATWSRAVGTVAEAAGMAVVPGVGGTWIWRRFPAGLSTWIGLPLDHVLARGSFARLEAATGEAVGSDHLPVVVDFALPSDTTPARTALR